jgi:hypothetical protein
MTVFYDRRPVFLTERTFNVDDAQYAVLSINAVRVRLRWTLLGTHRHELWIDYGGDDQLVFECREQWRVRQLARAVRRAMDCATLRAPLRRAQ